MTDTSDEVLRGLVENLRLIGCHSNGDAPCTCVTGAEAAAAILALQEQLKAAEADADALAGALLEDRTDLLWCAYHSGIERNGRWTDACMSDGEWLERECGLDSSKSDHDAEEVKAAIPLAAARHPALAAHAKRKKT